MRKVINDLLYDTETSELLYFDDLYKRKYYRTPNGRYFVLYNNGVVDPISKDVMKQILGTHDADAYIAAFGVPKEA